MLHKVYQPPLTNQYMETTYILDFTDIPYDIFTDYVNSF